jgi:hypothetical protein
MSFCPGCKGFVKANTREAEEMPNQEMYKERTLLWTGRKRLAEWLGSE